MGEEISGIDRLEGKFTSPPGKQEAEAPEEEPEAPKKRQGTDEEPYSIWLSDTPPQTGKKMDSIKWALLHGKDEADLIEAGYNPKTVKMSAYDLEKAGLRTRPRYRQEKHTKGEGEPKAPATVGSRSLTSPSKSLPPEFLIDQVAIPLDGNQAKNFELGMKFGLRVAVLGVRMAQELNSMGMQQVNPIIAMANAMRQGEAAAAKESAAEAAMLAAREIEQELAPTLAALRKPTGDPIKEMLVDTMRPIFQRLISSMFPGMPIATGGIPQGWTKKTEEG